MPKCRDDDMGKVLNLHLCIFSQISASEVRQGKKQVNLLFFGGAGQMLIKPMQLASCSMTVEHTQASRVLQTD